MCSRCPDKSLCGWCMVPAKAEVALKSRRVRATKHHVKREKVR